MQGGLIMIWYCKAYDSEGKYVTIFSPSFVGPLSGAFHWFSGRDFIVDNPNIVRIEIVKGE